MEYTSFLMTPQYRQDFLAQVDFELPSDYVAYLFSAESTHDFDAGSYLVEASELIQYNADYAAAELYPGYFLIGSTGGGESFAIEKVTGFFVVTPFIGHDAEATVVLGQSWDEFLQRLQVGNLFDN